MAILHVTGITPALSESAADAIQAAIAIARANHVDVSLDVNFRSGLWSKQTAAETLGPLARQADIVFAGEDEIDLLGTDEVDPHAISATLGVREVLVKRGSRGATAFIDGETHQAPLYHVDSVDPVGAGDAFAAGYLAARCRRLSGVQRLDVAASAGAFAVTVAGDWHGAPSWAELDLLRTDTGDVAR